MGLQACGMPKSMHLCQQQRYDTLAASRLHPSTAMQMHFQSRAQTKLKVQPVREVTELQRKRERFEKDKTNAKPRVRPSGPTYSFADSDPPAVSEDAGHPVDSNLTSVSSSLEAGRSPACTVVVDSQLSASMTRQTCWPDTLCTACGGSMEKAYPHPYVHARDALVPVCEGCCAFLQEDGWDVSVVRVLSNLTPAIQIAYNQNPYIVATCIVI